MKIQFKAREITACAMLIALQIVLGRMIPAVNTPIMRISFGFVPLIVCAMLFGPAYTCIVAAIADIIGALMFPTAAFFPGFTIAAFFNGLFYGLFLSPKRFTAKDSLASSAIHGAVVMVLQFLVLFIALFALKPNFEDIKVNGNAVNSFAIMTTLFVIVSLLGGLTYGLFRYASPPNSKTRIIIHSIITSFVCTTLFSLLANTLNIAIMTYTDKGITIWANFTALLTTRAVQWVINFPLHAVFIVVLKLYVIPHLSFFQKNGSPRSSSVNI